MALLYSLRSVVRSGVHQGFDLCEGRERGVASSRRAVWVFDEDENHSLSWAGEGWGGAGGVRKATSRRRRESQSVRSQQGVLGRGVPSGGASVMRMGTWSEPVEGRDEASQDAKAGAIYGLAKARSITPGLCDPERG